VWQINKYDKEWQNMIKNGKKGGGLAAPERASSDKVCLLC